MQLLPSDPEQFIALARAHAEAEESLKKEIATGKV
jgi:hypothetical protein